jgi:hypothetical protein
VKVVTNSRSAFTKYLNNANLRCRVCNTQQIANIALQALDDSHHGKHFTCLQCGSLNFNLVHHGIESTGGGITVVVKHSYEVLIQHPRQFRLFKVPKECLENVVRDYQEAAKLLSVSVMASAAFSRRCLQTFITPTRI